MNLGVNEIIRILKGEDAYYWTTWAEGKACLWYTCDHFRMRLEIYGVSVEERSIRESALRKEISHALSRSDIYDSFFGDCPA